MEHRSHREGEPRCALLASVQLTPSTLRAFAPSSRAPTAARSKSLGGRRRSPSPFDPTASSRASSAFTCSGNSSSGSSSSTPSSSSTSFLPAVAGTTSAAPSLSPAGAVCLLSLSPPPPPPPPDHLPVPPTPHSRSGSPSRLPSRLVDRRRSLSFQVYPLPALQCTCTS